MDGSVTARGAVASWPFAGALVLLVISAFIAMFQGTAWSMIRVWSESDTFAHGFVIFPISAFLVWRKRHELARIRPEPVGYGPAVLLIPGFFWFLGYVSDVQVIQQYCFIASIILLVWALLGWEVLKLLAFPLGYLLFAVPFGKFLVPYLIDFAAEFAVAALRLSGVPVFAQGASFSTPGADWKVVEVCSGMRYLIAALVVGTLYAYLNFRSLKRRLLFVLTTIVVTLIASGLRVYVIVMIGHFIDMKHAKGFDHLFIGWVFFGIVILLIFWIGSFWHEDTSYDGTKQAGHDADATTGHQPDVARPVWTMIGVFSLLALAVWPVTGGWVKDRAASVADISLQAPAGMGGWNPSQDLVDDWQPHYEGDDDRITRTYQKGGNRVGIYLIYYSAQRQGAELVNASNRIVKPGTWRRVAASEQITLDTPGLAVDTMKTRLYSANRKLLAYQWNWFDGQYIARPHIAKLMELKRKLLGKPLPAAAIVVFTDDTGGAADRAIKAFIADMQPEIERVLVDAAEQGGKTE
jgi:exosortase A